MLFFIVRSGWIILVQNFYIHIHEEDWPVVLFLVLLWSVWVSGLYQIPKINYFLIFLHIRMEFSEMGAKLPSPPEEDAATYQLYT